METVDGIVPEPVQGAHSSPNEAARLLKRSLMRELSDLTNTNTNTLIRRRRKRFRNVGEYGSRFRTALKRETRAWQAGLAAGVRAFRQTGETAIGPSFLDEEVPDVNAKYETDVT